MHVDPEGVMHPDGGDPVTIDGLTHIAGCEVCKVVRPWLHVSYEAPKPREPFRIKFDPEVSWNTDDITERIRFLSYYSVPRPYEPLVRGALMQSAQQLRESAEASLIHRYRWSFRCWLGLHKWHEQPHSTYERCTRCGKRERAF
jgi:metal-sulfur cluster biosynthetic enzyme